MRRVTALLVAFALAGCVARAPLPVASGDALILGEIAIPAYDIVSAVQGFGANGEPLVNVRLTSAGAVQLESITRAYLGREMPVRVGDQILSNPHVVEPIAGGQFQISGAMTVEQAQKLAKRISGR